MNAKQIEKQSGSKGDLNWSLIPIEKVKGLSMWDRLRKSFSAPDMNIETWERLEMKRNPSSFRSQEWRSF